MAERDVTIRLKYEVSGNALDYLRRLEAAQARVAGGQGGVGRGMPTGFPGPLPGQAGARVAGGQAGLADVFSNVRMSKATKDYVGALREIRRELDDTLPGTIKYNRLITEQIGIRDRLRRAHEQHVAVRERGQRIGGGSRGTFGSMQDVRAARLAYSLAAVGTYHVVMGGIESATGAMNQAQRGDLTQAQRDRAALAELPVIGRITEAGINLAHAIDGTTERIRQATVQMALNAASIQAQATVATARGTLEFQHAQLGARARELGRVSPVLTGRFDRTTVAGEAAYQAAAALAPHQQAVAVSEAEMRAAGQATAFARRAVDAGAGGISETEGMLANAMERRRRLRAIQDNQDAGARFRNQGLPTPQGLQNADWIDLLGGIPARFAIHQIGGAVGAVGLGLAGPNPAQGFLNATNQGGAAALEEANRDAITQNQQLVASQTERHRLVEQLRRAEEAEGQAAVVNLRARIGLQQAELALLQQREQLMGQATRRLVMMNPFDRQMAINAFREGEATGHENQPYWRQMLSMQIAPNTVGRALEANFQRSDIFRELERRGEFGDPGRGGGTSAELRDALKKLTDELASNRLIELQQEANSNFFALNNTMNRLIDAIERANEARVAAFGLNLFLQSSQQAR